MFAIVKYQIDVMVTWSLEHVYTVTENMRMFSIEESAPQNVELKSLVRPHLLFFNCFVVVIFYFLNILYCF